MEILQTADDFKTLVKTIKEEMTNYKDPIAFGICKVNKENNYQPSFYTASSNENFSSAAIFIKALSEQGIEVDFNKSEIVCHIDEAFLKSSLNSFAPFIGEAHGDSHKNIQTILALYKEFTQNNSLKGDYKVIFIFSDDAPQSAEANYLKAFCEKSRKK